MKCGPGPCTRIKGMRPILTLAACAAMLPSLPAQKQPFTVDALLKIARISDVQLSPNGRQVAFTVQTIDLDKNTKPTQIYVIPTDGGVARQITPDGANN